MGKTTEELQSEASNTPVQPERETQTITANEVGDVTAVLAEENLPKTEEAFEQAIASEAGLTTLGEL